MNLETADVPAMSRNGGNIVELIDSAELANRWKVPESWIRNHTRARTPSEDRIPCIRLGRYVRFEWGSPALAEWLIQSTLSGIFSLAKQLGYFEGVNPVQDTRVDPTASEPAETYAYSLEEVQSLLALLPEPAATAFAVAAFMGLRIGELEALRWEDYRDGEMHISRSIWNGRVGAPKTRKSAAPVPAIRQVAERLEMHRLHSDNPHSGPIFANSLGNPMSMNNLLGRVILPVLIRSARCGKPKGKPHLKADHEYRRDARLPQWLACSAPRPGQQSVSSGCAGYGYSANPPSLKCEHDGELLHQDRR